MRVTRVHLGAITKARGSKSASTGKGRRDEDEGDEGAAGDGERRRRATWERRRVEFSDPLSLFTLSESRAP